MTFLKNVFKALLSISLTDTLKKASKMRRGGRWGSSNRFNKELAPNQKKITQFFRKAGEEGAPPTTPSSASSRVPRPLFRQTSNPSLVDLSSPGRSSGASTAAPIDYSDDEDIEILTPPTPPPAVVIVLTDSEEQEDSQPIVAGSVKVEVPAPEPRASQEEGTEENLSREVSASANVLEEGSPNNEDLSGGGMSPDSSGDEILSQIDIEEVVRLSQSSREGSRSPTVLFSPSPRPSPGKEKENVAEATSSSSLQQLQSSSTDSTLFLKPPKRSPKSQLNKFSPVRHLTRLKRTSSEASLDATSSPSPSKNGTGTAVERRSPKKKLNFDNNASNNPYNSTTTNGGVGGGRYYLRNFMSILVEVISDRFHAHLLNDEDHKTTQAFTCLSLEAQSLYVRLFQRKWGWKPINKLNNNYKELPQDLSAVCKELTELGFLEEISASNSNLEEVLDTLDLVKMGNLAKKMMISQTKKTKEAYKEGLLAKVRNQKTLSGTCGSVAILKSALAELGPAFRVSAKSKTLFSRLFILHSPPHYWEVEQDQASNQLLVILLNNMGQMEYPTYQINKTLQIFRERNDLIRFHEAFSMHSNLVAYSESKDYLAVVELAKQALSLFQELLQDSDIAEHDSELPRYLRIYTAGSALCHTCWMGVDGFQKLKRFSEANQLINTLLDQTTYLSNYRGRLWERLAINGGGGHLKESKEATRDLLEKALRDPFLQDNHKLILSQRLEKIRQTLEAAAKRKAKKVPVPKKKNPPKRKAKTKGGRKNKKHIDTSSEEDGESDKDEDEVEEIAPVPGASTDDQETQLILSEEDLVEPVELLKLQNVTPTRTIMGEKMDRGPGSMGKSVFISRQDSTGSNRMSSVEQHAIQYYLEHEGYTGGIHGEGSTVVTLYGLLFWDVIFDDSIPDAFHTRYQAFPLDLHFDDFYLRRQEKIEEKLDLIQNILSIDDLFGVVSEVWAKHEKELSIVSWSLWENNLEGLRSLMKAMGTENIAKICGRLARNYRYYSSGFPDVVVWNEKKEGKVLFVEVKGPGDSLSAKQELWLDFLVGNEIPAEVCHVKAVSNKRIRLDA